MTCLECFQTALRREIVQAINIPASLFAISVLATDHCGRISCGAADRGKYRSRDSHQLADWARRRSDWRLTVAQFFLCLFRRHDGLLYLLDSPADAGRKNELGQYVTDFIDSNPGVAHPVSDRWATSLIPAALTAAKRGSIKTEA
jgi:hypothetical protein